MIRDPEIAEKGSPRALKPVHQDFRDKLSPAERWIRSHVGEPWDDVYSKLRKTFDVRTTPGRHIVFDHILPMVKRGWAFSIDEGGILSEPPRRERSREPRFWIEQAKTSRFVGVMRIGARGAAFFWFAPTVAGNEPTGRYRQDRRLTEAEVTAWTQIERKAREAFSVQSQ